MKIAIVDYQLSNLFSVLNACKFVGLDARITYEKKEITEADAIILPGVGSFGNAMENLKKLDLIKSIKDFIASGKPFMGICLGMQLLMSESEECGPHKGLDIIKGSVKKIPSLDKKGDKVLIPQIGWNKILKPEEKDNWLDSPLKNLKNNEFMYFVHSYYVDPVDKNVILAKTEYAGIKYCSAILYNNVFALQFHPEKSGKEGIKVYKDWFIHN